MVALVVLSALVVLVQSSKAYAVASMVLAEPGRDRVALGLLVVFGLGAIWLTERTVAHFLRFVTRMLK